MEELLRNSDDRNKSKRAVAYVWFDLVTIWSRIATVDAHLLAGNLILPVQEQTR